MRMLKKNKRTPPKILEQSRHLTSIKILNMKKLILFFFFWLSSGGIFSQSISPEVIATAGDHFTGTNVQMSWTIGEIAIETLESGSAILTQGFHQPNLMITSVKDLAKDISVNIYPNPTSEIVHVELNDYLTGFQLVLSDNSGRILTTKASLSSDSIHQFDLSGFASGIYFLRVINGDQQNLKTFKIIKSK